MADQGNHEVDLVLTWKFMKRQKQLNLFMHRNTQNHWFIFHCYNIPKHPFPLDFTWKFGKWNTNEMHFWYSNRKLLEVQVLFQKISSEKVPLFKIPFVGKEGKIHWHVVWSIKFTATILESRYACWSYYPLCKLPVVFFTCLMHTSMH